MVEQREDDEVDPVELDRPQDDVVQPYSCITTDREDCHQQRLLAEVVQIGFHHPIPASRHEKILPSLERRLSGRSIHERLLPNLAETSEQSDPQSSNDRTASSISNDITASSISNDRTASSTSNDRTASSTSNDRNASSISNDRTASSTDVDQTSVSDDYIGLPLKTVDNDIQFLTTSERINPVTQHMVKQALQTDRQSQNFDITNNALSLHPILSTNSQPAIRNSQAPCGLILPPPNDLVRHEDATRQILSSTSQQQLRNSILPELNQNADGNCIDDRILLPISIQHSNSNISETDRHRPTRTDLVLPQSPSSTTLHRSEFQPSVVIVRDRFVVNDNTNSNEHINPPFNQHVIDHHGVEQSQQRILPKLLESGRHLNTRAVSNDLCESEKKGTTLTERTDGEVESSGFVASIASDEDGVYCSAEVPGQSESWEGSSSPFSSQADDMSQTSEDESGRGRAELCAAPRSIEDDEGIYL